MRDEYPYVEREMRVAEASKRWAILWIYLAVIGTLGLLWWFVQSYYGDDGVRVLGLVLGVLALVLIVIAVGWLVQATATGMAVRHHNNILTGLVRFQQADDRGEVARTVAAAYGGVLRSGNQVDAQVLRLAGQFGRQQAQALTQAQGAQQRQQAQLEASEQERGWWSVPAQFQEEEAPPGW